MENARRIAELEDKIELLTEALRDLSIGLGAKQLALSFAVQSILRLRGTDPEFAEDLRTTVADFVDTNNPPLSIESSLLEQMNALLEAAGEPPQIPNDG